MAHLARAAQRRFEAALRFLIAILFICLLCHAEDSIMVWALLNQAQNVALNELLEGQQSDRIVAIIGGAMLDDSLRHASNNASALQKTRTTSFLRSAARWATLVQKLTSAISCTCLRSQRGTRCTA
jgi:uncharacterized protein (DUF2336 family)